MSEPKPISDNNSLQAILKQLNKLQENQKVMEDKFIAREKALDERELEINKRFVTVETNKEEEVEKTRANRMNRIDIMREKLKAQPKVRIYIPPAPKEKAGSTFSVTLNGYRLNIPIGKYIDVPEQVADIIRDSFQQTDDAINNKYRLDTQNKVLEGISIQDALN